MVRLSQRLGVDRVVVVAGLHLPEVNGAVAGLGAEVVENPDWRLGRTGSVQVGLRAAGPEATVLIWPVDHPFVALGTLRSLLAASEVDRLALWLIPTFQGRGGHPVLLRGRALSMVSELSASAPLRSLLPVIGPEVRRVAVADPGVLDNVDAPQQYLAALDAWASRGGGDG
jgi:CTP:molybdopterin cytidylyltransferase MocA